MKLRLLTGLVLAAILTTAVPRIFRAQVPASEADPYLTAHEWGTFTSISGQDGHAMEWLPLDRSTDLPSFVEHFSGATLKQGLVGTVRMETPVLYFYTNRETTVSVHVSFSKGLITEWYPQASQVYQVSAVKPKYANFPVSDWALYQDHPDGSIGWDAVQLQPRSSGEFAKENQANRYYAARQTSATSLQVKTPRGPQSEKFLFYRGVATFNVPVLTKANEDGSVFAENLGDAQIPAALLFERRGERIGFRVAQWPSTKLDLPVPELNGDLNSLRRTVVDMLVAQGLYQDEAQAMFETWRDSWFEEGSRLLYIVPRGFVDSILPLTIHPVPSQTVRVFVGRIELVTPATRRAVEQAIERHDYTTLALYNRFLTPILQTSAATEKDPQKIAEVNCYLGFQNACAAQVSGNSLR